MLTISFVHVTQNNWRLACKNLLVLRHLTDGDMLLRMKGGTPAFVDSLIKGIDIHSGSAIKKLSYKVKSTGRK